MAIRLRSVTSSKNTIRFGSRLDDRALHAFLIELDVVSSRGHREVVLDFRRCEVAYPDSVLPLICIADQRSDRGLTFKVVLPQAQHLNRLFLNANWAHLL